MLPALPWTGSGSWDVLCVSVWLAQRGIQKQRMAAAAIGLQIHRPPQMSSPWLVR